MEDLVCMGGILMMFVGTAWLLYAWRQDERMLFALRADDRARRQLHRARLTNSELHRRTQKAESEAYYAWRHAFQEAKRVEWWRAKAFAHGFVPQGAGAHTAEALDRAAAPTCARVVVGSALMGDSPKDCDYVDAGDGAMLRAAVASLEPTGGEVRLREGVYLGGLATSEVPANVRIVGPHGKEVSQEALAFGRKVFLDPLVSNVCVYVARATTTPGGRYRTDGNYSGEWFRDDVLKPAFDRAVAADVPLVVELDGVAGYASSFLDEVFGGLADQVGAAALRARLRLHANDAHFRRTADEIWEYINERADSTAPSPES